MSYIGNTPAEKYSAFTKQDFSTSATSSYTLSQAVANENEIALFINFVRQEPTTAYTASGTSLTLTSATSGSDDMYCVYLGKAVQTVNPPSGSVGNSQVASTIITGQTAETSIATDDLILLSDTSASGALKKMTRANFVSGIGATNTPNFSAAINSNQDISNNTATTVAYANELFDTGSDFNNSTYKWTVGETGKYLINIRAAFEGSAEFFCALALVKDGVGDQFSITMGHDENNDMMAGSILTSLTAGDTYYVTAHQTSGGTVALIGNNQHSEFSAFKLAE